MITKLFISQNLDLRIQKIVQFLDQNNLKLDHPDLIYFEDNQKLGVEQAKKIKEFLSIKPFSVKGKAVAVVSAQNLTVDAQNALLKTLEEPPGQSIILLGTDNENSLLPTIISRCEIVILEQNNQKVMLERSDSISEEIEKLINSSIDQRFEFIEKLEQKQEFLDALLSYFRQKMLIDPKYLGITQKILQALEWSSANGNQRAILEYLMLNLP